MVIPSSGPISFSALRTEFTTPGGGIPLSVFYGAQIGIPLSGSVSISSFQGKSAIGSGVEQFAPSGGLSTTNMVFRLDCPTGGSGSINYTNGSTIMYHFNPRPAQSTYGALVQNNLTGGKWGTEQVVAYNTIGISKSAPWTLFIKATSNGYYVYNTNRTQLQYFANRNGTTATTILSWSGSSFSVKRVMDW